jgi:hypothetical protein
MDMRYHWLIDRVQQKQFDVYWRPGRENLGNYHTKHHSTQHHEDVWDLCSSTYNHCMRTANDAAEEV